MYRRNYNQDKVDRVKELTDKLEAGVKDIFANPNKENGFDPENYKKYLETVSKFHNYSFNNCVLIAQQNPNASFVAGYKAWQNNWNRHVKKGETGIKILAPNPYKVWAEQDKLDPNTQQPIKDENGNNVKEKVQITKQSYRAVSVFDVSQTEGKELPRELSHYTKELQGDVTDYNKMMEALKQVSPVPMEYDRIYNGSKGYFSPGEQKIVINEGMSQLQDVKTAVHEMSHAILHDPKSGTEKDQDLSRNAKEVEAESVAYTVCQHFGIDTSDYSFGYVANWSSGKDMKELTASMETIRKTAGSIIDSVEEKLQSMDHAKEQLEEMRDLEDAEQAFIAQMNLEQQHELSGFSR